MSVLLDVPYITEEGRIVFGSDIDLLFTEQGRRCTIRPLQEIGRRTSVVKVEQETVNIPIDIGFSPTMEYDATICNDCWDLRDMLPRKFRRSAVLMDYLHAINQVVNSINCRINTLQTLTSIDECPKRYLGHLAALIGFQLTNQKYATAIELRNQLKLAVEMYKIKGTYRVLEYMFYLIGLHAVLYDLWTIDYVVFERRPPHQHSGIPAIYGGYVTPESLHVDDDWFMDETTPQGGSGAPAPWHFDSGAAFKSPHFDIIVELDKIINFQGYYDKLFVSELYDLFADIMEEYTPINTVPHFYMSLLCQTYENFLSYTIPNSQVKICLTNNWLVSRLFFDMTPVKHTDQVSPNDIYMDQSFEAMLSELTVVKIGNGNKGHTPLATDTDLVNIVWTGTVSGFSMTQDKIKFQIVVPAGVVLDDVSELGIYNAATGELIIESCFLDLDKPSAVVLEITVEVIRTV